MPSNLCKPETTNRIPSPSAWPLQERQLEASTQGLQPCQYVLQTYGKQAGVENIELWPGKLEDTLSPKRLELQNRKHRLAVKQKHSCRLRLDMPMSWRTGPNSKLLLLTLPHTMRSLASLAWVGLWVPHVSTLSPGCVYTERDGLGPPPQSLRESTPLHSSCG